MVAVVGKSSSADADEGLAQAESLLLPPTTASWGGKFQDTTLDPGGGGGGRGLIAAHRSNQ